MWVKVRGEKKLICGVLNDETIVMKEDAPLAYSLTNSTAGRRMPPVDDVS
jgi:hypothetical protein